ncbi:MAG: lysophospholipase [Clostridiales Family XIII bacterium]|jgi:alpha-beta hydrolase superfamily lysophospholipase|nr:lysophospholipase [Clostridiales Family XIII bacterium]
MIKNKQWMRAASSGREDIFSQLWVEDSGSPRAVIQLAHGMAEHSARYDEFARFLAAHGFIVCMNEHAGHGSHAETLGYFAEKNGLDYVVSDMKALMDEVTADYPSLPVFLFGHSMGSFLSRKYITLYGDTLTGCILSGTAGSNPALGLGILLSSLQKKIKGPKSVGKFLSMMAFGSYTKKIKDPVNLCAWLSSVDDICIRYKEDDLCGFCFTASGYHDLFTLLREINRKNWFAKVSTALPVYLMSGAADPVGAYGKGVTQVYERLKDVGVSDLTMKLYPGGRHEMLNEANKYEVYEDILAWLESRAS